MTQTLETSNCACYGPPETVKRDLISFRKENLIDVRNTLMEVLFQTGW